MKIFQSILDLFFTLLKQRRVFYTLIVRDFKSRYLSSYIGLPWAFIQPTVYLAVVWFAFAVGLRGGTSEVSGMPFAVWLISGLIPWLFISQTMIVMCASIMSYSYLIKKTNFPVIFIPIIKIFSGMLVHFILLGVFMALLLFYYGISPSIYWIQIIYYQFVLIFLLTGIGLFVSSMNVFVRDITHMVGILTTILFWATPLIWNFSRLEGNYRYIALLNPFFYITEGYRYTFVGNKWFFEYTEMNIYFWSVSIFIFIVGVLTFRKLRPHFGDVL